MVAFPSLSLSCVLPFYMALMVLHLSDRTKFHAGFRSRAHASVKLVLEHSVLLGAVIPKN